MRFELILTYGSALYTLLLIVMYFKKQTFKDVRVKIYKLLIITGSLFIITQIGTFFVLIKYPKLVFLQYIFKLNITIGLLWWLFLEYYNITLITSKIGKDFKSYFKSNIALKIYTILVILAILAYIIIPMNNLNPNNIDFLYDTSLYFYIGISSLTIIMILINIIKNNKLFVRTEKLLTSFNCIVSIVALILQIIFKNISILPLCYTFIMFIIYFYIENPDLKIIKELAAAKIDIEKSNQTKTDFLSNMTYEIKVPMSLIISLCDEINSLSYFNEKLIREDITQISSSGNSLLDIINNILDISKIETGKSTIQEKDYKLSTLLSDIANIAKSKIGSKQVKFITNIDKNISTSFNGDYSKIYQILTNIVSNAAKYTDVGKITFTLTSTKSSGIENLLFKVSDTGSGIKEEDKAKLFKKGTKLGNTTQGEIEGSGLGLAITKEYVELLGGKIWFDSQYRVGTTFYIELPQKIVDSTPIGNSATEQTTKKQIEKVDCSKYTVLIVDDNKLNIKVAKRLLESYKFNVESVMSGKDCVYKIKEGTHYDGIFMDHMMPEMDGIETLHILKKLNGYELPPIIALTANAVAGMREMYLNEGFDEYLSKPINANELDRIINMFFNK